jgi:mono/diheme cytochrome c family protein
MRPGLILLAAATVAGGCDEKLGSAVVDMALPPTPPYTAPAGVIHGKYLVEHLLFCGNCHTPTTPMGAPDTTKVLAGGRAFAVANGATTANIYAANITNDTATGLGGWTDDQIKSAITKGIDKDDKPLYPTMPYSTYSALNEVDLASIVLYLRTLSVANAVPENVAMPPAAAAAALDDSKIPHSVLPPTDINYAIAERGRYLAKLECVGCHTPKGAMGADYTRTFAGGIVYKNAAGATTAISTNLTPDPTGIKGWSVGDFAKTLRVGQEKGTGRFVVAPMPSGPSKLGGLIDDDLNAMATYFLNLAPVSNGPFGLTDGGVPFGNPDGG